MTRHSLVDARVGDHVENRIVTNARTLPNYNAMWHVLQCVGRNDQQVLKWMERDRFETYYPQVFEMKRVARRHLAPSQRRTNLPVMRSVAVPLFPRYIFVRFDIENDPWRDKFKFAGASGMVCAAGLPVQVPDELIDRLKGKEIGGVVLGETPANLIFKLGEQVRVSEGQFIGHKAEIEGPSRGTILDAEQSTVAIAEFDSETRIKVLIDLLGRKVAVDLEIGQIERL